MLYRQFATQEEMDKEYDANSNQGGPGCGSRLKRDF